MELRQLATFRSLATTLSFTRTAAELHYVQSTVTTQIQALEADLGCALFDRLGRRVMLTDAGRCLLPYADRLLSLATEARAALIEPAEVAGTLTLTAPETLCAYRLPPLLRAFRVRFPAVQLVFRPLASGAMLSAVGDGTVDLAFVLESPLRAAGLTVEPLVHEPLLVLARPDHRLAQATRVRPIDLASEAVLLTEAGCAYRALFLRELAAVGARPATVLEFGSVEAIKQCVMAGLGLTLLPAVTVAAELARGHLVALPWAGNPLAMVTHLVWHPAKWPSPALRAFLDLARALPGTPEPRAADGERTPVLPS